MTSPVDIRPDHLAIVQGILREHMPGGVKVWVFGSRASWTTKDSSDLDLALECESKLSHKVLGALKDAFEDSTLPYTVDVVDLNRIGDSFREIVESQKVPLVIDRHGTGRHAQVGEWRTAPWGELATLEYGKSLRGYDSPTGNYKVYGTNGPIGWHDEPLCPYGSVIIGRKGAYRGVHYSPEPFFVIDTAFYLKPKADLDTRWAYYQLLTQDINGMDSGSAIPSTSREDFYGLPVDVPPLPKQRDIAHVLGTLDDKIELNRRINETLEAMARALFKSWFVDFDPVRAKMEGRWRPGDSLPGLPSSHYDLFPDRLVDSELGEMPEEWEVKALGEVVRLNPREPMKRGTLAPYLDMAALPTSGSSPDNPVLREYKSGTRFRNGDTLLARITPCLENGKTALVQSLATGTVGWGSTEFIVLRAVPPVPPEYTYLLARDDGFREHAIQSMTGTSGRQRVQVDALAPYSLPGPPAEFWNEFSALVSPLFARIEVNRRESLALAAQRDALLPGLVSGELRVEGGTVQKDGNLTNA